MSFTFERKNDVGRVGFRTTAFCGNIHPLCTSSLIEQGREREPGLHVPVYFVKLKGEKIKFHLY